jgi:hypothetical protein
VRRAPSRIAAAAFAVLAFGVLWTSDGLAQKPAPPPQPAPGSSTWFVQTLSHSDAGLNVAYFWSKGPKLRTETVIAGRRVTTIVSGNTYYAYDAVGQVGVAVGRSQKAIAQDAQGERPFGREFENLVAMGAERVRDDKVMGRECEVYRLTDALGRRELCVTKDKLRLPVRVTVYRRDLQTTTTTDFINWLTGLAIADSFFEAESSVALERFDFEAYARRTATGEPVGPVPILYTDLLVGK